MSELTKALVKAQSEFPPILKVAANPHLKNRYADLQEIVEKTRPVLAKNGLCIVQPFSHVGGCLILTTKLMHEGGEEIVSEMLLPQVEPGKGTTLMQALGSAITYARRYGLVSMLNLVAEEDDDGNAAHSTYQQPKPQQAPPPAAPPPAPRGTNYSVVDRNNAVIAKSERVSTLLPALAGMRWTPELADLNYDVAAAALKAAIDADKPGAHVKIKALRTQAEEVMAAIRRAMQDRKPDDDMANGMIDQPEMADA